MTMLREKRVASRGLLPDGAAGIDAGLTLTKTIRVDGGMIVGSAHAGPPGAAPAGSGASGGPVGVTGARAPSVAGDGLISVPEIDAAAAGVRALSRAAGAPLEGDFLLALLGTGTSFAAVRDGKATHLGGTALGGGSFAGIAARFDASLSYEDMVAAAARGDRRNVDVLVSDAYPGGIGRIGGDLTAAHLGKHGGSLDDALAALLNLHGENIGQIAASRALVAGLREVVLAGGFVHGNEALSASLSAMIRMFGLSVAVSPAPGYAGAVGAAFIACQTKEGARS